MKQLLIFRWVFGLGLVPLLGGLGGCAVYDSAFHPYRLPTPSMTSEAKAKARAAEKARHRGTTLAPAAATTDENAGAPAPGASAGAPAKEADDKKKTLSYSELPAGTKLTRDKHLLLKKPRLARRQRHIYDTKPLPPTAVSREMRRLRHPRKGGKSPGGREAPEPADDQASRPLAPPARAAAPPASPAPKPDPTQPAPAH